MERNYSGWFERALGGTRLELLHLLAYQASILRMPLYLVGGVVRDILLSRPVYDFDLVVEGDTAMLAEFVLKKYGGRIMLHSQFGTAKWVLNEATFKRLNVPAFQFPNSSASFDLISARSEFYARPGALPTVVKSTIDADLHRRDFTINAMAFRLDGDHFGELFDPLDGRLDLERKLIRVLHPDSFIDDPTRMFRAVRYARRYGFAIEVGTLGLINDEARGVLSQLSGERLRHEFDLIFEEQNPTPVLKHLAQLNLLRPIHIALPNTDPDKPALEMPDEDFGEITVPNILSFRQTLGWVLYLLELTEADIESIAKRLSFPVLLTKASRAAASLYRELSSFTDWKPSQWTFHLDSLPAVAVYAVYLVKKNQALHDYLVAWRNVKPHTTGYDLQKRGLEPGPKYREILSRLRAAWLDGEVKTEEEEVALLGNLLKS